MVWWICSLLGSVLLLVLCSGIRCDLSHGLKWSTSGLMHLGNSRMDISWMLYMWFYPIGRNLLSSMAIPECTEIWELKAYYRKWYAQLKISGSVTIEDMENAYWRRTGGLWHRHLSEHFRKKLFRVSNVVFVAMEWWFVEHLENRKKYKSHS